MTDFAFTELLPLGPDATTYRKLDIEGVSTVEAAGHTFLTVEPQVLTALAGQPDERIPDVILAYEPRWAIGGAQAATPEYVAERHAVLRSNLGKHRGRDAAERTRIIYGGSVTPENGPQLIDIDDVDGLFVGRAAWTPEGFARIIEVVAAAAQAKRARQRA